MGKVRLMRCGKVRPRPVRYGEVLWGQVRAMGLGQVLFCKVLWGVVRLCRVMFGKVNVVRFG